MSGIICKNTCTHIQTHDTHKYGENNMRVEGGGEKMPIPITVIAGFVAVGRDDCCHREVFF